MSCYSCGGNPNTFCGECVNNRDTWITLVDALPDVFMGDFDHLFRTPDGNLYALSPDRTRWIQVNGSGGGNSTTYNAGDGIEITQDGTINNTKPNKPQNLSINGRTISISNGNSITLPEDSGSTYDDEPVIARLNALEAKEDKDTKYKVKGNGLILDDDNAFSIDMRLTKDLSFPYSSSISKTVQATPDKRYESSIKNSFAYAIDNDGTPQNNAIVNGGIVFDYEASYTYGSVSQTNISGRNTALTGVSTNSTFVSFGSHYQLEKGIEFFSNVFVDWKDSNNKVVVAVKPKIVWSVNTGSHTENYTHYLTKEEIDSAEPIEIEVKEGESTIGRLNLTIKNVRFFIQSTQGKVVAKNPSNNDYYNLLRY